MGKYRRNKIWWIDYYYQGGRYREPVGTSKALAEKVLKKRQGEIVENKFLGVRKKEKVKFEEMAQLYLNNHSELNKKPSSCRRDKVIIKNLLRFFGGMDLHSIGPLDIENYKINRQKQVTNATVNRELACLKNIFSKATQWNITTNNPTKTIKLLSARHQTVRYLEKEEIGRLLKACPDYLKPIVTVAVLTGMRKAEIFNLDWKDVNFNQRIITLLDTKNKEKREVRMNDIVYNALLNRRAKYKDSLCVFPNKEGKPYQDLKKSFHSALKKSGIQKFRFHDLRHTWASQMVMTGVPLEVLQKLGGWKSYNMVLRYAHLSPNYQKRWVDHFEKQMVTIWSQSDVSEVSGKEAESSKPNDINEK